MTTTHHITTTTRSTGRRMFWTRDGHQRCYTSKREQAMTFATRDEAEAYLAENETMIRRCAPNEGKGQSIRVASIKCGCQESYLPQALCAEHLAAWYPEVAS